MLQNVISDNLVVAAERETLDPCYWSQNRRAEKHPKVKIDNSEINLERIMFKWIRTWSIIKIKKINNKIDFLFLFSYYDNISLKQLEAACCFVHECESTFNSQRSYRNCFCACESFGGEDILAKRAPKAQEISKLLPSILRTASQVLCQNFARAK